MLWLAALTIAAAPTALTTEEALSPYSGPIEQGVDTTTLHGKVMCGYQGWFLAEGDGFGAGDVHWGGVRQEPPRANVDLWPDLSELDPDELFATNYRHGDGRPAHVFSSGVQQTVLRHFSWMRDYGIDGAFVQRFTACIGDQTDWNYRRTCAVLSHCREGANRYGRAFAVMYDTDFDRGAVETMKADWRRLIDEMQLTATPAYLRHRGGPLVALWGYGFDHRKFDAEATRELFEFLARPENGGCTIMLGVPNDWATWTDERMSLLTEYASVVSPWNVGRYGTPEGAAQHAARYFPGDLGLCDAKGLDYYAVAFPGFSWTNLMGGNAPLNQIPRLGGRFLWSQIEEIHRYGMDMAYVAMFDEVDEGTAIFKCTNDPPVGRFCTYEGLPSDRYLTLTGLAGRYLRGEQVTYPEAAPDPALMAYRPVSQLAYYAQPSRFASATTERWRQWFAGMPVVLHGEPYSDFAGDLYNSGALDVRLSTWSEMLAGELPRVLILAPGGEGFSEGDASVGDIVAALRSHLAGGGIVAVLGGGGYPLFYPGGGVEAAKFGFRLRMVNSPAGSRVTFAPALSATLAPWEMRRGGSSRLMTPEQYPDAMRYIPLATVTRPDGSYNGEAIALVQPGGELGEGAILYVASDLTDYPDREGLLDAILGALQGLR